MPWNFLVKFAARRYGVINPLDILAKMRSFAQPSEIAEPLELLRAGILFHARGLINTRAIQHNLDWVWPFWVERQFNPNDPSFIPRAFSFSHVNLTHRNWTAVGHPDLSVYPIVDPRGLVTPLYDGWSLDFWIIGDGDDDNQSLFPSKAETADQFLEMTADLAVSTTCQRNGKKITSRVRLLLCDTRPVLEIALQASGSGRLAVALRPYNPEGIQFVEAVEYIEALPGWRVNRETAVMFSETPEKVVLSTYQDGDVRHALNQPSTRTRIDSRVGMATAAALFPLAPDIQKHLTIHVPLEQEDPQTAYHTVVSSERDWDDARRHLARLSVPDEKITFLYQASLTTLLLLSSRQAVPGPYTYNRFWFRDACLMLHALLAAGAADRVKRLLDAFPEKQKHNGYFQSQEGEWDSNGQVLWIMDRFHELTGRRVPKTWQAAMFAGADWIQKKRLKNMPARRHNGLLPPGFSAEHFGPNDYYFWDNFWGLAGFRAAARQAHLCGDESRHRRYRAWAADYEKTIFRIIESIPEHLARGCIPAAPGRRMDAGAVGSLVADYPLGLAPRKDRRIMNTVTFLMENCFFKGGFFQDMIHSGINAYLTLSIAQTLLRNNDPRFQELIQTTANLASSTGQWPEAIHPQTLGGCMGDGQHGWAAAEWVMMIRNLFVREKEGILVIGSGIFPEWMHAKAPIFFGPTPTHYGTVSVHISHENTGPMLRLDAAWRKNQPELLVQVPGYQHGTISDCQKPFKLEKI